MVRGETSAPAAACGAQLDRSAAGWRGVYRRPARACPSQGSARRLRLRRWRRRRRARSSSVSSRLTTRLEFSPHVLQDVSSVDTSTVILGRPAAAPFGFAPTGFTRMMHTDGEPAVARVAERAGIPYALSTMGTTSIEELAAAAPDGRRWFQLYLWRDREASRDFVARAQAAGYEALVLTVDTPVPGPRLRDVRNGLTIPPSLSLKTFAEGALHPGVVVRPLHHRAARVRLAQPLRGHRRRARRPPVRPGRDDRGPRLAALHLARAARRQGHHQPRPMPGPSSTPERMPSSCPTTAGGSSTAPPPRWRRCPRWSTRWATGPRCTSTEASCPAATSSPRWRWGRGGPGGTRLPLRADGRRRAWGARAADISGPRRSRRRSRSWA